MLLAISKDYCHRCILNVGVACNKVLGPSLGSQSSISLHSEQKLLWCIEVFYSPYILFDYRIPYVS